MVGCNWPRWIRNWRSWIFWPDYELSVRGERAAHIKVIDYLEQKRIRYWDFFAMLGSDDGDRQKNVMNNFWVAAELYLMPKGWFYQNKIPLSQMHQQWNLPAVDDEQQMVLPKKIAQANKAVKSINGSTPFNFFARLLLPELGNFAQKTALWTWRAWQLRWSVTACAWRHFLIRSTRLRRSSWKKFRMM
jgi:hypothetical protein